MFTSGLAIFTLASLGVGLAQTQAWLIGARAVQGVGAAVLAPSVLALISATFPEGPERTRALARYSMVAGVGASLGLVLGGVFADEISWRVGFLMNVPIGLVLWFAARRSLAETARYAGTLDVFSAAASTLGMGALVFGIVRSADAGWTEPVTRAAVGTGIVLLTVFLVVVFASANAPGMSGVPLLDHRIAAAITGGGIMLGLSVLVAVLFVLPAERARALLTSARTDNGFQSGVNAPC